MISKKSESYIEALNSSLLRGMAIVEQFGSQRDEKREKEQLALQELNDTISILQSQIAFRKGVELREKSFTPEEGLKTLKLEVPEYITPQDAKDLKIEDVNLYVMHSRNLYSTALGYYSTYVTADELDAMLKGYGQLNEQINSCAQDDLFQKCTIVNEAMSSLINIQKDINARLLPIYSEVQSSSKKIGNK